MPDISEERIRTLFTWHQNQLGTAENPKGSNNVIYNTMYYNRVINDPKYHWCLVYIWAGFHETGMDDLFYGGRKTASCTEFMRWAKSVGRWIISDYKRGDIIFFDFDSKPQDVEHVGFVVDVLSNGKVHTIEGNTNDKVENVFRPQNTVAGAYRPNYGNSSAPLPTPAPNVEPVKPVVNTASVSLPMIKQGDEGPAVKTLQQMLIAKGYSVGPDGADGEFGPNTRMGLRKYQLLHGLTVDGICGPETHASFWEV